jgi:nicotinamidase-related amidase
MKTQMPIVFMIAILQCSQLLAFSETDTVREGKYLLVVNMQKCFTEKNATDSFVSQINELIGQTDTNRVIYIRSVLSNLSLSVRGVSVEFPHNLHADERLKIVNNIQFSKNKPSTFSSEEFLCFIDKTGADEFIVVGMLAGHSVLQTLTDGKNRGYTMHYIPNLILDKTAEDKNKAIALLEAAGISANY